MGCLELKEVQKPRCELLSSKVSFSAAGQAAINPSFQISDALTSGNHENHPPKLPFRKAFAGTFLREERKALAFSGPVMPIGTRASTLLGAGE